MKAPEFAGAFFPAQPSETMDTDDLVKREFCLRADMIHLNHAAVAPWPQRTYQAVADFAAENARQGSLDYPRWLAVEEDLRQKLAQLINAPSEDDIALLKNTSEALSVVAHGLPWKADDNVVVSNQEFPSNRIVWESLRPRGVTVREVDLTVESSPEDALLQATDKRTRVLAISSVQYATGLRIDIARLGAHCRRHGILLCVDAIQSVGALDVDVQAMQADFLMADGHKWMLGPEGLALFYCRPQLREQLELHQYGWHMVQAHTDFDRKDWQPATNGRRFECGSPNMLGIHALDASVGLLLEVGMAEVERRLLANAALLMRGIAARPRLELLTTSQPGRHGGIVTFRHKDIANDVIYRHLMSQRVLCAKRGGGIRFSPHFYTPTEDLERALALAEWAGAE